MEKPSPLHRELAGRLLAAEARSGSEGGDHATVHVCRKLSDSLIRFAGVDGFTALLRRSLALARADFPVLVALSSSPDGVLEGGGGTYGC